MHVWKHLLRAQNAPPVIGNSKNTPLLSRISTPAQTAVSTTVGTAAMANPSSLRLSASGFCTLLFSFVTVLCVASAGEPTLVAGEATSLQLSPNLTVQNRPGMKPGTSVNCERVYVYGLSRLKGIKKFAHSVKVKVFLANSSNPKSIVEVCFHGNTSLGIGRCSQGQWEKVMKGIWIQSMSPFDHKLLDICSVGAVKVPVEVLIEEEFHLYRILFLISGITMWTLAPLLSKSLVFYYSGAMAVGVLLVILMVLFQGMKLLPTGRKSSVGFYLLASIAGLGSYLLRYLPNLLHSILMEMGISKDMYYPVCSLCDMFGPTWSSSLEENSREYRWLCARKLAIFLLAFLFLVGAWLGFWFVRKLVLADDGSIDMSTSLFVAWSIRIVGAIMILQTTLDHLLAVDALVCGILVSTVLRRLTQLRFLRRLYRSLFRRTKIRQKAHHTPYQSPMGDSHDEDLLEFRRHRNSKFCSPQTRPFIFPASGSPQGLSRTTPPSRSPSSVTFYSTFHTTPERKNFSKDEWDRLTKEFTKGALEGLVSSPDFNEWAAANAERLTLRPRNSPDTATRGSWWFLRF